MMYEVQRPFDWGGRRLSRGDLISVDEIRSAAPHKEWSLLRLRMIRPAADLVTAVEPPPVRRRTRHTAEDAEV
jgi:hypothetical protein